MGDDRPPSKVTSRSLNSLRTPFVVYKMVTFILTFTGTLGEVGLKGPLQTTLTQWFSCYRPRLPVRSTRATYKFVSNPFSTSFCDRTRTTLDFPNGGGTDLGD